MQRKSGDVMSTDKAKRFQDTVPASIEFFFYLINCNFNYSPSNRSSASNRDFMSLHLFGSRSDPFGEVYSGNA